MKSILLIFSLVVAIIAQDPCDIPPQFMCRIQQVYHDGNNCDVATFAGELYFDYPNQQLRIDESATIYDYSITESVYLDYDNEIAYYYDRTDDYCTYDELTGELNQPEIPFDATYEGTYLIGSQGIDVWVTPDDEETVEVLGVTENSCYPVIDTIVNTTTNYPIVAQTIWNVLPELPPFYFDIPDACKTAKRSTQTLNKLDMHIPYQSRAKLGLKPKY